MNKCSIQPWWPTLHFCGSYDEDTVHDWHDWAQRTIRWISNNHLRGSRFEIKGAQNIVLSTRLLLGALVCNGFPRVYQKRPVCWIWLRHFASKYSLSLALGRSYLFPTLRKPQILKLLMFRHFARRTSNLHPLQDWWPSPSSSNLWWGPGKIVGCTKLTYSARCWLFGGLIVVYHNHMTSAVSDWYTALKSWSCSIWSIWCAAVSQCDIVMAF